MLSSSLEVFRVKLIFYRVSIGSNINLMSLSSDRDTYVKTGYVFRNKFLIRCLDLGACRSPLLSGFGLQTQAIQGARGGADTAGGGLVWSYIRLLFLLNIFFFILGIFVAFFLYLVR
jgi:hypothetical protein